MEAPANETVAPFPPEIDLSTPVEKLAPPLRPVHEVQVTPEQAHAISLMLDFIQDPEPPRWYFVLSGYAGTGKTFCMREVIARSAGSRVNYAFTTPTNKSAKVLRKITGSAGTIYSLLGLRIDKSGEIKQVVAGKKTDLSGIDVIVVDEGGMVNRNLFNILRVECEAADVKVIFMGDPAQLPPVGELESPIWGVEADVTLTRVMRHDNQILTFATLVRDVYRSIAPCITLKSDFDELGGVWKLTKRDFKESIYAAAVRGDFGDGATGKVIAWRNVAVDEYNNIIRHAIFGAAAKPGYYLPGDRLVATGPCERADEVMLTTDDEAIVESITECVHPLEPKYRALELKCRTELNKIIRLLVIHPESALAFANDSESIAHQARGNGKLWKKFWEHKDLFHTIKYAYALTVHRSQGSTYENVWVDASDILKNRTRREAFQCLYTASTRPTTKLFLAS